MKRWHQWLPALNCPCGIPYFSFFAMLRAFSLTSNGKMARPLFRFSVIHSRRSTSSSGYAAFLPRFARFNRGIFSKFSLLFRHKQTLLSDTPNSLSAAWFPCVISTLCSGEFCSHVYVWLLKITVTVLLISCSLKDLVKFIQGSKLLTCHW